MFGNVPRLTYNISEMLAVPLQGNVLRQVTGLDGFTVMGGEMIIEYQ